jgi:enoyl-CoA hydratase/carnithine racemase
MNYTDVLIERINSIGIIILNRPEHYNTFNVPMAEGLNSALSEMENDSLIRVVIVKGAGKNFCAGIDVRDLEGKTNLEYLKWVELMEKMSLTIASMGKPVIASVHNVAVANGIGLVAACDLAVASENAKFGATAINVGLFCMGPAVPLSRSLGRKRTLELLLTGDIIDAYEAEKIGLINKVVPDDLLDEETMKLALKLASKSPLALQLGKKSFYKMEDLSFKEALDLSNNHFATLCTTEDAHEGVEAFLKKRQPQWNMK